MEIRLIRNATLVVEYADKTFLIDPFLAKKGAYPPFPDSLNQDKFNPTAELPIAVEDIIEADVVIVTHLHPDHYDTAAIELLPKHLPILAQSAKDAEVIKQDGFLNVQSLTDDLKIGEIRLTRTDGQHGTGEIGIAMGPVSGVVFQHPDEKTLYIAGDTIWCSDVEHAIQAHNPEVIVVNSGAAQFLKGDPITMTKEDIIRTYEEAPQATVIVAHMESVNHCLLSREELKRFIDEKELNDHIIVPDDGDLISLSSD